MTHDGSEWDIRSLQRMAEWTDEELIALIIEWQAAEERQPDGRTLSRYLESIVRDTTTAVLD